MSVRDCFARPRLVKLVAVGSIHDLRTLRLHSLEQLNPEENPMVKAIVISAFVVAIVLSGIVAYASIRPDTFSVQRSANIDAPAEAIFPLIANLQRLNTWNPFVDPDPAIKITYSGPESGKGAIHTWSGNRNVGEGRIEITDVTAPTRVVMKLDMLKPMQAHNTIEFSLHPNGNATTVTWAISGQLPLIGKVMTLFSDCDKMIGSQFDKGLASLKAIAER
jgi:hypothetical protein